MNSKTESSTKRTILAPSVASLLRPNMNLQASQTATLATASKIKARFPSEVGSVHTRSIVMVLIFTSALSGAWAAASPVAVRYQEGLLHGFLVLSTLDGKA